MTKSDTATEALGSAAPAAAAASPAPAAPASPAAPAAATAAAAAADEGPSPPLAGAPGLCDDCVTDRPTPAGRSPTGEIQKFGDVDTYIAKPASYPRVPARLLLLLTGGTGVHAANNQLQADQYAAAGYVVVMPDLFGGDVAPNVVFDDEEDSATASLLHRVRTKVAETAKSFLIDTWLARHTDVTVLPVLRRVLAASRAAFADAVAHGGGGVYAAGYCFGGRYVLLLATPDRKTGGPPPIQAGALAHATLVSPDDFAGIAAPLSMACVENDPLFPDAVRTAGEDTLNAHNVEHEVQVYPGVPHGFAVVGDYADETIQTAQQMAFEQMVKWLDAH